MTEPLRRILCTLGPASMNDQVIRRLEELGVSLFRINLSHTALEDVRERIRFIKDRTRVPICLDTEGAQIRTGWFVEKSVRLRENSLVIVPVEKVAGNAEAFNLYPDDIVRRLEVGDFISIDFDSVLAQVIDVSKNRATMRVVSGGMIGRNKAVTAERQIDLPPLTKKDIESITIGFEEGIRHFALSFANCGADVELIRGLAGAGAFVISKIESLRGIRNLDEIARNSDAILIDRGDLSREAPIERIPALQKHIIGRAKKLQTPVYVATNLLESMISERGPTRAEVNDIFNTLADGADGLVLAAETAIGDHPVLSASMAVKMIRSFAHANQGSLLDPIFDPISLVVEPHGGRLVHREATAEERSQTARLPMIDIDEMDAIDCEQIATGAFSPLEGFMERETLESVLVENRLPGGIIWTLPILLQTDAHAGGRFGPGDRVSLRGPDGRIIAFIDITEIFKFDLADTAARMFGTSSSGHPGVLRFLRKGDTCLAGKVTLVKRLATPYRHHCLSPAQTRLIFARKGWSRVVGFHTHNVVHRAHHHIQIEALVRTGADGLFISPLIGPEITAGFLPDSIMKSYHLLLELGGYPENKVVLGAFHSYPRHAGPRETVFAALCRKNLGCSHFILGRDPSSADGLLGRDADRRLFDELGDIGIQPVPFEGIGYDPDARAYLPRANGERVRWIDGSDARKFLAEGRRLPDWYMHDAIQDMLLAEIAEGRTPPNK